MATLYVGSDQTYKTVQEAVNAASATEANEIIISAGTYNEDITLDARTMEQKGNIKFIAAEGAEVIFAGLITIGYYEKKVASQAWQADVAFENITFDQATDAKHSIDIQQCNDFTMTNCKVIGDGEYGISGTNVDNGATITGTTFENAAIQSAGSFGTDFLIDDCTFNESRVNIQSGNSVTIKDSTFNGILTDANVGDSFYCIRSNDNAINIENTTFNIDSELTEVAGEQEKWGVLWQRNAGGTKWSASDIEVNFSEKAMAQTELLFNKNGTTTAANEAGRITINGLTSTDNDVTDLLAKSEGVLNASADGVSYVLDDGVVQSKTAANQLVVSADVAEMAADAEIVIDGYTYIVGKTAFATINAALTEAKKSTEKITIEIAAGDYTENVSFGNRTFVENETTYTGGITFKAVDGAEVNINGYFQCNSPTNDIKDVVFEGLNITNSVRNGGYFAPIMFGDNYAGKTASGIAVKNCTLTSTATGGTASGVALAMTLKCDGIDIIKNTINADCGVYGGDGNLIANTNISGNTMNGNKTVQEKYNYWGMVYIYNSGEGNVISENEIKNSALDYAVRVRNGEGVILTDNNITDCGKTVITNGSVVTGTTIDGSSLSDSYPAYDGSALIVCGGIAGETGDTVVIDGKSYVVGTNAYDSLPGALNNAAKTEKIEIVGDLTEAGPAANTTVELSKTLTISGGNVTWTSASGGVYFCKAENAAKDTKLIFDGFALNATEAKKAFFFDIDTVIDADSEVSIYNAKISSNSTVEVQAGGKFNVYKEELQIDAGSTLKITGSEVFTVADAELDDRQMFLQYSRNVKGTIEIEDAYVASYQGFYIKDNGKITADNSLIELGNDAEGVWHYNPVSNGYGELRLNSETAELNLNNGSVLKVSGNVINSGLINVDGSSLIANGTLVSDGVIKDAQNTGKFTNNGTIKISGDSTLVIRDLAGKTLTFGENAALVDSTINYTGSDSMSLDGATFKGDNTINAAAYATSGAKITVAEGGSLTATGGRWAFGGNADWEINGEIEDVKALTAEERAALKASLNVSGLSLSTGGGEAVMDVNNAYITYGSGALTTKNTNVYGGKMTLNFTNSYLASGYKIAVNPTKDGYDAAKAPEVEMNFKGSVVEINNYFTNNHAKGTVNIDNTDFTATAFGNVGKFNVTNGSKVNFALVNNALGDWAGKGSLNAGSITVDASELTIANKTATLELYNVGEITLSNGATFTLDQLVNAQAKDLTGSANIDTTFADMSGSITIDATSLLTVTGKFENAGSITIDGTGFAGGTKKLIDLNIDSSLAGSVTAENLGEGVSLAYGKDGDVLITDASMEKIWVNSAYADKEFGRVDGDKVFGINALSSLTGALDAKTADTEEIVIESDIADELSGRTISGKLTADSAVTVTDSANSNYVNFTGTTLDKNITVDAKYFYLYGENTFNGNVKSSTTFYSSGKLTMNGNAEVYTTMSRYYANADDGIYVVGTAAAGEGKNAAVQYKSINYLGHYSGTFSVKDTAAEFGYILLNGSNDGNIQAQLVLDNAKVSTIGGPNTQPGQVLMDDDAAIIATNGSVLDFRGPKDFGYLSMKENNSISLTDSTMYLGKDGQGQNTLNGTITLNNSELNSLGKITNNGTIKITGDSTLNIGTLAGKAIELAGTLVDSTIGGEVGVKASAEGGFAGENKVYSAMFYKGADITVKEGADVDVTTTLATYDGASLNVEKNAEIDAQSIYFNGGSIEVSGKLSAKNTNDGDFILNGADDTVTINAGGVLDVNYVDAYYLTGNSTVELYGEAKTSFKLSDGQGKFTWNVYDGGSLTAEKYGIVMNNAESAINVYGDATASQISNAGKITVDGGNFNVTGTLTNSGTFAADGGTVKVGGELRVNTESAINVEKSTLTAGTVYNSGSVTVYNDSTFTVNGAFNGADGVVNINIAEGSYGMWKVIDAEDNADSDYGKVNVNIGGTWVDEAGDLWAYNTTFDTIYVNAEWDDETNINLGDGKVLGVNAFASLDDIAENATDETTAVVITGGTYSSVSGEWVSLLAGGINSVTADGTVTLEKYGNLFFKAGAAGTYTISGDYVTTGVEGFLWEGGQNLGWKVNGVTRFEGADGVVFNITNATFTSSSAIQFIDAKAVIDANSSLAGAETTEGKLAVYGSEVVSYGKIALVTSGNPGTALLIGNAQYAEKGSSLTVSGEKASVDIAINGNQPDQVDANIHASGALTVEAGASFTAAGKVINAGTVKVNKASYFNAGTLDNSGYMDVTSSKLTAETVVNTGDVKVNGSSILVKELDNAEGTLDVTGDSYLEIGKLTGEINANDATLNGSIIGGTLNVTGASDVKLTDGLDSIVLGSMDATVDAEVDVTGWDQVVFTAQNGTVDITGKTEGDGLYPMKVGGFYKDAAGVLPEEGEAAMGSTTVNITKDAYVKANQVYIAENSALKEHTLNVDGALETNSIWNKALGNLNVTGKVSANYLQAAGDVTVSGENAKMVLTENNPNNGATKIGTDVEGLRSQFVIEEGATVDATGTVYVGYSDTRNGDLLVNGAVLNADTIKVQEGSTFAVAGDSTVTAKVYGDMALKNGAVLNGNVSIDADGSMIVDGKAALGAETAFSGVINGGDLAVSGSGNDLAIIAGGNAALVVDNTTVFDKNDGLGDILLKGADKDTVLTVADAALNGNTIENLKLNITDADNQINVNTDLANIYMVNDFAVKETMGIYYYEHADGEYMYLVKEDNMINITAGVVGDDDETSTEEFDKVVIDSKNASTALAGVNLVMGDGKTSFTVKNGSKTEDVVFAIGGIHKSELGGSTTVKIGNYTDVTVNGDVENISQFTTGKDGKLTIAGDVLGQNTNNTVSFGANNDVEIKGGVNLFGGKNKIAVGANSTVDVTGSLLGVADLNIAKEAMVVVDGMYEAAAMNNKITLANKATLNLGGIDNGGVDRGTGTTVKVGKESTMIVNGDANGIAGITVGNSSEAIFNYIEGTEKTNKISIGNDSRFYAENINLAGGKNSITSGKGTDVKVGNITNVTTVSVGAESSFTAAGDVTLASGKFTSGKNATVEVGNITNAKTVKAGAGELASFTAGIITNASSVEVGGQSDFKADALKNVNKFTVANGKAASKKAGAVLTNAVINGNVEMTAGKDTFKVGANTSTVVDGEIAFGEGKDTLSMGKNAMLKVNAVSGMEVFNATDSSVLVATNGKDVDFDLGDATGSWNKATIIDMEGELEVGTNDGSVYANEFDYYEFNLELGKSLTFENLSEGIEIKYQYELNGVWTDMLDYKDGLTAAGDYRVFVGVSSDEFSSKNEKLNYILDAKLA